MKRSRFFFESQAWSKRPSAERTFHFSLFTIHLIAAALLSQSAAAATTVAPDSTATAASQSIYSGLTPEELYTVSEKYYRAGCFYDSEKWLQKLLKTKANAMLRSAAYRLLALNALERGNSTEAHKYVEQLLKNDPYFTPTLNDPQHFVDILNEIKSSEAGITTASRQAESLDEAPVPVTLITEDMIRHSGCSTLQELLCLYVPGMTIAEGMETNIAMHGIYSLFQEKILFMVDGHRLNSSATNAEAPDYRSSLDKIQQIEVLRGPASSLYGNVALTAVVNIITRKGAALNGARFNAQYGTQKTMGTGFVVGGGNNVVDVLGWGSINSSNGFAHTIDNHLGGTNTLYVNGFNHRPSYDLGIRARWKDFTFSLNLQRSKRVPYINVMQVPSNTLVEYSSTIDEEGNYHYVPKVHPEGVNLDAIRNYNYDSYSNIGSDGPGVTRTNNRLNLDYSHSFDNFDVQASAYLSMERTSFYNVLADSIDRFLGYELLRSVNFDSSKKIVEILNNVGAIPVKGVIEKLNWENVTIGAQAQILTNYEFLGHGSAIFGGQYEHFALTDGTFMIGGNYGNATMLSSNSIFQQGNEFTISGYAQLKHFFSRRFIFNAGIRFDHKERFNDKRIDRLSPRFSLIYKLGRRVSLRGSYNHSFVDAPYIYRSSKINLFSGGPDMKSETMDAFQIGATYHRPSSKVTAEVSCFYNLLENLTVLNQKMKSTQISGGVPYIFVNAGKVREFGVEGSFQYNTHRLLLNANATYQRIATSEDYITYEGSTFSTPKLIVNLMAAYAPYRGKGTGFLNGGKLWLRGNTKFQSRTYTQTLDLIHTFIMEEYEGEINKVNPQFLLNLGIGYEWKYIDLDLSLRNVFNNEYAISSMLTDAIPHPGRQFIGKLTVKF